MAAKIADAPGGERVEDWISESAKSRDPTECPFNDTELEVAALKAKNASLDEKVDYLMQHAIEADIQAQRDDDEDRDGGIRLFARMKRQPLFLILTALTLLTMIYAVQLVTLYNLGRFAREVTADRMTTWVERGQWQNRYAELDPKGDTVQLSVNVSQAFKKQTASFQELTDLGFCMTNEGVYEVAFNIGAGLVLIYLFIFNELFFVTMNMPLTRNFPNEPYSWIMFPGIMWTVFLCGAVLTWLGVIAGWQIIAYCGSFFDVLQTSLSVFIVIQIDDQVLPVIRWFVEERNQTDHKGVLPSEYLKIVTFGNQYYKPGYGHNWWKKLQDPRTLVRVLPIPLMLLNAGIILVPAAVTVALAATSLQKC